MAPRLDRSVPDAFHKQVAINKAYGVSSFDLAYVLCTLACAS